MQKSTVVLIRVKFSRSTKPCSPRNGGRGARGASPAAPCRAVPGRTGPGRTVPCRTGPHRAVPAVPYRAVPYRAGPGRAVPGATRAVERRQCHLASLFQLGFLENRADSSASALFRSKSCFISRVL